MLGLAEEVEEEVKENPVEALNPVVLRAVVSAKAVVVLASEDFTGEAEKEKEVIAAGLSCEVKENPVLLSRLLFTGLAGVVPKENGVVVLGTSTGVVGVFVGVVVEEVSAETVLGLLAGADDNAVKENGLLVVVVVELREKELELVELVAKEEGVVVLNEEAPVRENPELAGVAVDVKAGSVGVVEVNVNPLALGLGELVAVSVAVVPVKEKPVEDPNEVVLLPVKEKPVDGAEPNGVVLTPLERENPVGPVVRENFGAGADFDVSSSSFSSFFSATTLFFSSDFWKENGVTGEEVRPKEVWAVEVDSGTTSGASLAFFAGSNGSVVFSCGLKEKPVVDAPAKLKPVTGEGSATFCSCFFSETLEERGASSSSSEAISTLSDSFIASG